MVVQGIINNNQDNIYPILFSVDAADGSIKSKVTIPTGYPLVVAWDSGTAFVAGLSDGNHDTSALQAWNTTDGKMEWSFPTGGAINSAPAVSVDSKTVFFGSADGHLYAVDAATGGQTWSFNTSAGIPGSPMLSPDGKTVYVGSLDTAVYALDTLS